MNIIELLFVASSSNNNNIITNHLMFWRIVSLFSSHSPSFYLRHVPKTASHYYYYIFYSYLSSFIIRCVTRRAFWHIHDVTTPPMPPCIHQVPLTAGQFGLRKCLCSNRKRQLRLRALVQRQFLTKTVEMRRRRIVAGGHLFTTTKG